MVLTKENVFLDLGSKMVNKIQAKNLFPYYTCNRVNYEIVQM